eukprot:TRINITY_DN1548_c0_g3_i1.p1 TRINITY_DN1548_c0_g3~~TRINITY_DN1548_c0_g3_i1.p1  ORF type:complete len:159 (-),score=1.86 TRINITY_DN1548_c0_g3_i1:301-777(-)
MSLKDFVAAEKQEDGTHKPVYKVKKRADECAYSNEDFKASEKSSHIRTMQLSESRLKPSDNFSSPNCKQTNRSEVSNSRISTDTKNQEKLLNTKRFQLSPAPTSSIRYKGYLPLLEYKKPVNSLIDENTKVLSARYRKGPEDITPCIKISFNFFNKYD